MGTDKRMAPELARMDIQGSEEGKKKRKGERGNVDKKKEGMGRRGS